MIKRRDYQAFQFVFCRSCRGCGLGELAGSRALFLREQVRDLRVQMFLRELVVGVAAPSDLAGSIVEILHCGEGGGVSKWLELKIILPFYDCSSLSQLTCVYILHAYFLYAHPLHA